MLQWFTGNIGFHHIHHLSPRIPNYYLEKCHNENEILQHVSELTVATSLKTLSLTLWDEQQQRLVTFRQAMQARLAMQQPGTEGNGRRNGLTDSAKMR